MTGAEGLLVMPVLLPLLAAMLAFLLPRYASAIGVVTALVNLALALYLAVAVVSAGVIEQHLGGWAPPLGIALRLDGLAVSMLLMTAIVALGISGYAVSYFSGAAARGYWPLWLFLVASMAALFLSRDLFNLYVTLELLGISAVALTALEGGREALIAAMRYLLASLAASLAYLLGVAICYHSAGSVDLALVAQAFAGQTGPAQTAALSLMTVGLLLKGALFPLHFWLPSAHASASAPVSAALSALVVKGAFVILLRLWLEVFPVAAEALYGLLALLGGAAVLWGSLQAIVQVRLKLLIAYSTVAQLGYLFLALPLVVADPGAWSAIVLFAFAHGLAKAAMFLAAGNLQSHAGHDRLAELGRAVRRMPLSITALGLAGVSIMGLPPSGGFNAKWLLLGSAAAQGRWDIVVVLLVGGLLAAVYMFKLVEPAFGSDDTTGEASQVPRSREFCALGLAAAALMLGLLTVPWLAMTTAGGALTVPGAGG